MATMTLFDLITLQRNDQLTGLVEDVTTYAPEFGVFAAVPRPGTFYEVVRRTSLPTVGFRNVNEGTTPLKSAYKKEVKQMFFLDGVINMDEAITKADDRSVGDAFMLESQGVLRGSLITIGTQVWYGTSADAKGFAGIRAQLAGSVVAGGSTNSTSAYLLWMDQAQGVRFDVGQNGAIALPAPTRQQIADPNDSTKVLFAWVSNLSCWIGLNVISAKSTWAVTGITTHQTSTVYDQNLTDSAGQNLISNIPLNRRQNLRWFINRTSEFLLAASRSTINNALGASYQPASSSGTPAWSPLPNNLNGYPITVTDSITNSESN